MSPSRLARPLRFLAPAGLSLACALLALGCGGGGGSAGHGSGGNSSGTANASGNSGTSASHSIQEIGPDAAALAVQAAIGTAGTSALEGEALTTEGTLSRLTECSAHPRDRAFLDTERGRLELDPNERALQGLAHGSRVRVQGTAKAGRLALASGTETSPVTMLTEALTPTAGSRSVAIVLVNFSDAPTAQPETADQVRTVLEQVDAFYRETSYGSTSITGAVFGWFTIPLPSSTIDADAIAASARTVAQAAGTDLSSYQHLVFCFPQNAQLAWWGLGTVGGSPSIAWVNGTVALQVVAHELGHGLGLRHSHSPGQEYGDPLDVMGQSAGHFDAFQKERLGWLGGANQPTIAMATSTGTYRLDAYETQTQGTKALKITRPGVGSDAYFYVEARRATGADASVSGIDEASRGVFVRTASTSDPNSSETFAVSSSGSVLESATLVAGSTATDAADGVTLETISADESGAVVQVTITTPTATSASAPAPVASRTVSLTQFAAGGADFSGSISITGASGSGSSVSSTVTLAGVNATIAGASGTLAGTLTVTGSVSGGAGSGNVSGTLTFTTGGTASTIEIALDWSSSTTSSIVLSGSSTLTAPPALPVTWTLASTPVAIPTLLPSH